MTTLRLHNLLHVPSINKNLKSVSQFAKDNSVYFEFFPNHCFVKNQDTKEIILQGKVKDGLYMFLTMQCSLKPSVSNTTLNPASSTFQLWHSRLGHASSRIVHNVMKLCNVTGHKRDFFCQTCAIAKSHQLPFNDFLLCTLHRFNWFLLTFGDLLLFPLLMDPNIILPFLMLFHVIHGFIFCTQNPKL